MTRVCRLLIAALLLPALMGGCRSTSRTANGHRSRPLVGVSFLTETHAFYKDLEQAMRSEAAAKGMDLVIVACEMDPAKQASQVEDFITQHVDAMIIAPCDSSAIVPYLARAADAHIPVFTVDIAAHGGPVVAHVASDNVAGGRMAAATLARLIGDQGDVIIIDHPEVASVQDRTRGFEEELKQHPNVHVVDQPSASGQRAKAMSVMEDMLQAHRGLRGVFAINDDTALGVQSVLDAAGRRDVVVVGFDATDEAKKAIAAGGVLKADIAQHPLEIGKTVIDTVARSFAGEQVPPVIAVPVSVVDAASLSAAAPAGGAPR
jgi:ribose transport system substrate-binding protein